LSNSFGLQVHPIPLHLQLLLILSLSLSLHELDLPVVALHDWGEEDFEVGIEILFGNP